MPSSILGAFSRPVPPPSSDDRRKDVRARAAVQLLRSALAKEGNYTDQPEMAIWVHDQRLEMLNFHPPHPIVQGENRRAGTSRLVTRSTGIPTHLTRSYRDFCRRGGTPHRLTASAMIVISNKSIHPVK